MMELFSRENDTISNKKTFPPGLILLLLLIEKDKLPSENQSSYYHGYCGR